jgi:hypothetical protein
VFRGPTRLIIWTKVRKPFDEVEDKAIAKLGVTYCVLRRLGFSESRVLECLRTISGVELEEAYDWVGSPRIGAFSY